MLSHKPLETVARRGKKATLTIYPCLVFMLLPRQSHRQDICFMYFSSDLLTSFLKRLLDTTAAWNVTSVSTRISRARFPNRECIFQSKATSKNTKYPSTNWQTAPLFKMQFAKWRNNHNRLNILPIIRTKKKKSKKLTAFPE